MELKRIKELIDLFAATDLGEINLSEDGCRLRLVRRRSTAPEHADTSARCGDSESSARSTTDTVQAVAPAAVDGNDAEDVVAPLYGVLHLTPSPGEPAFVELGDPVRAGQTLCVLEAMKMFHTVTSAHDGVVAAILVASGSEVEAGQALFRITSRALPRRD